MLDKLTDLDEFWMHDGVTWTVEGPRGKVWSIVWQPGRAGDTVRAWPFPAGRTQYRASATTAEEAREKVLVIAEKIRTGK